MSRKDVTNCIVYHIAPSHVDGSPETVLREMDRVLETPYICKFERLNQTEVRRTYLRTGATSLHSDETQPEYIYVEEFIERNFANPRFDFISRDVWYTKW